MIQKITINTPSPVNFFFDGRYDEETVKYSPVQAETMAKEMTQISNLLNFITKHPDRDICAAITYIMDKTPEVKWNGDKTERRIKVSYLLIVEVYPTDRPGKPIQNLK